MGRTLDKGVLLGIGLVVAVLVGNAFLAYRNTSQLLEDAGQVAHTHEVLDLTADLLRTLVDAETGQRGYLLTGKDSFLEPYRQALGRLDQEVRTLQDKTQDNPRQQARIEQLRQLTAEQLALLQKGIDLHRQSPDKAQAFVATGQSKANMDALRQLIATMEGEEHDLLKDRDRRTAAAYRYAVATALLADAVGLILVGAVVYLLRRSLHQRTRAAARLHEQRERLQTTLTSIGDAVIVTDAQGRVTLMNPAAEALTGWQEAAGRPLEEVFRIANEQTRQPVESPVTRVLREGVVVGLANHTVLIGRDGTERPIDDSGAPVRGAAGDIVGVVLVFRDVTERRRLEQLQRDYQVQLERQVHKRTAELRASEERFRLLVEGTQDYAMILLDPEGRVASWNPGAERLKGYRAEEIIGQHFSRFYPAEAVARGWPDEELRRAAAEGRSEDEAWRVRKDGSTYWSNVIITALKDEAGNLRGFSKITRDLTARKQAEQSARRLAEEQAARRAAQEGERRLRESEEKFRLLADTIPQLAWMARPDGHVFWYNRRWYEYTGTTAEQVAGWGWQSVLRPQALPTVLQRWRASLASGEPFDMVFSLRGADGQFRPFLTRANPLRDEGGRILLWCGTSTDIGEQKRAEDTSRFLADASAALAAVVDYQSTLTKVARLAVPFFADWCIVDMQGADGSLRRLAVVHADPSRVELARELYRQHPPRPDDPHGAPHVLRTGQPELTEQITDAMLAAAALDEEHLRILRGLGLRSYIAVPLSARGKTLGVLTFLAAESGRRYSRADLALAEDLAHRAAVAIDNALLYAELRRTDRLKDEFLAMLAHELRNPLAPIRNALQIMKMPGARTDILPQVRDMAERQVRHMARLLDDLLDMSRINRGRIELRKEVVDVAEVVGRTVEAVRPVIDERRHELTVAVPAGPPHVQADPTRLEQVLTNLLNNAAKYTDPGGHVWITAERDGGEVVLRVRDTGIGIAPEVLPHIFDLFVQAERRLDRSQGGVGIGLTLVKRLVELHGGSVAAHSAGPGQGSEFVIRLPATADRADGGSAPAETPQLPRRRILVVDDSPDAADSLTLLLRLAGQEVRTAYDGPSALALAQEFRPEVVFLDIGMPGMDGHEVARRLRRLRELAGTLVVALTGWGQEQDRRQSQEAGFDRHLVKPVEPHALNELLADVKRANG
jgi:PAS domain S-box-containing protein